jgi:Zn-dependent metalloprotease
MKQKTLFLILTFFLFALSINAQTSTNEAAARKWISSHSRELKLREADNFKLSFVRKSITGETLRFQQMMNDVPVAGSEIVVHFNTANEISFSSNSYDETITPINTTPSISNDVAISKALNNLKLTSIDCNYQECKLVVKNVNGATKLIQKVICNPNSGEASWESIVDAQTGDVLTVSNVARNHHKEKKIKIKKSESKIPLANPNVYATGTAMVFDADPLSKAHVTYGTTGYVDGNDANTTQLTNARTSVVLPEIDLTSGTYKLKSSYVEIADFESPNKGLFTQTTSDFNFTRDNDAFEAVNAFYFLDKSMRYINETLGVPCRPSLNGGIFKFDPSGLSGADNSHYIPSTEQIAFGEGCVDDAEDADVVLHEFGHGIHDWLTGGNSSSATGLGEGSGDYWAVSYSNSLNQWLPTEAQYNWVFSWDGHDTCWSGRVTNYTRTYPQTSSTYTEIHEYGQIWATALMKIYNVIGRIKTDKAFLEGLALTGSSTTQPQAAVAVRQAAIDMNYPCADIKTMTEKFTAAGYAMPTVALKINCPANQTVAADTNNTYVVPSYASLSNAISQNCDAVVTQDPPVGSVLAPGTYPVTMTATSGTTATCNFTLIVTPNLSVAQNVKQNVVIFPNPAKNQITIKGEFDSNESITIFNLLGQRVIERNSISSEERIDVSKLESGVYTVYFNSSKSSYKFVKE